MNRDLVMVKLEPEDEEPLPVFTTDEQQEETEEFGRLVISEDVEQMNCYPPPLPSILTSSPASIHSLPPSVAEVENLPLRDFLLQQLLHNRTDMISWVHFPEAVFVINDPPLLAKAWGKERHHPAMNYEKLARSLRYYYSRGVMHKMDGLRFHYRFCKSPVRGKDRPTDTFELVPQAHKSAESKVKFSKPAAKILESRIKNKIRKKKDKPYATQRPTSTGGISVVTVKQMLREQREKLGERDELIEREIGEYCRISQVSSSPNPLEGLGGISLEIIPKTEVPDDDMEF